MTMAIHRDDIPMDAAEGIVEMLQKLHPGAKVVFAGDGNDQRTNEMVANFERVADERFFKGQCLTCGKESGVDVVAWLKKDDDSTIPLPDGWHLLTPLGDGPFSLECPDCDDDDDQETPC